MSSVIEELVEALKDVKHASEWREGIRFNVPLYTRGEIK